MGLGAGRDLGVSRRAPGLGGRQTSQLRGGRSRRTRGQGGGGGCQVCARGDQGAHSTPVSGEADGVYCADDNRRAKTAARRQPSVLPWRVCVDPGILFAGPCVPTPRSWPLASPNRAQAGPQCSVLEPRRTVTEGAAFPGLLAVQAK